MYSYLLALYASFFSVTHQPQVILVTIDGVRYQEVFQGTKQQTPQELLPNLYNSFVSQGVVIGRDSPIITSGPNHVSLPGYLEIIRGHPSTDCQNNFCAPVIDQSILWYFQHPAVFASWSTIGRTLPHYSNLYGDVGFDYRLDQQTEKVAVDYLSEHNSDFVWIALGDTDEYAHQHDYFQYIRSLQEADRFIGFLVGKYPDSTVIVTTDHGRAANLWDHGKEKDSERVWLMMRGHNIPNKGFVTMAPASLSNILPTIIDIIFDTHSPSSLLR